MRSGRHSPAKHLLPAAMFHLAHDSDHVRGVHSGIGCQAAIAAVSTIPQEPVDDEAILAQVNDHLSDRRVPALRFDLYRVARP